ncbi:MAG: phage tail sheath subtilisin-like domain-containing protein [Cyclobacteriaceae bacterium]|nr:phage tail sheath subtilisin-like domain-containing protein [Cyclobacteriaceae bacterium]
MATFLTPGVYIEERNAFPNSVVAVPTSVPAFVGYTELASRDKTLLRNKPTRITSISEYHQFFGKDPFIKYEVRKDPIRDFALGEVKATKYYLYNSLRLFFANGGSTCYIVSVGDYNAKIKKDELEGGIKALVKESEPSMLVIPDALGLDQQDCYELQKAMLNHCGSDTKNRIALLDVYDGYKERTRSIDDDVIIKFREGIGNSNLAWGAAYFPWLNTNVVQDTEINYKKNISNLADLQQLLNEEIDKLHATRFIDRKRAALLKAEIAKISSDEVNEETIHQTLVALSPLYQRIVIDIKDKVNMLPPCGGIAGVISMVDNSRGVWKSPANVSINQVISPAINITNIDQEDINVPADGKSINAIRSFPGQGVLVWGARTLDGNSSDWKYISVRRTVIMIEESLKTAIQVFVFEPNDQNTWLAVKAMISNFLTDQWRIGALAGSTTKDAFFINLGLGTSMTQQDILSGWMKIIVGVALVRPAEFIVITLQQQMPKS